MATKNNPNEPKKTGRKSLFTEELGDTIAEMMSQGNKIEDIASDVGISARTIHRWVRKYPVFCQMYAHAREELADKFAEKIYEVASTPRLVQEQRIGDKETVTVIKDDVQARRLEVDTLKWLAAKYAPRKYGDRLMTEHSGTIGVEEVKTGAAAMVALNSKRSAALESLDSERPADA